MRIFSAKLIINNYLRYSLLNKHIIGDLFFFINNLKSKQLKKSAVNQILFSEKLIINNYLNFFY
jgi:hypothetical protein